MFKMLCSVFSSASIMCTNVIQREVIGDSCGPGSSQSSINLKDFPCNYLIEINIYFDRPVTSQTEVIRNHVSLFLMKEWRPLHFR